MRLACFLLVVFVAVGAFPSAWAIWGRKGSQKSWTFLVGSRGGSDDDPTKPFRPTMLGDESNDNDDKTKDILIVMDGFCPYHGGYLIREAQEVGQVRVVLVLGDYLRNFLLVHEPEEAERWQSLRIPTNSHEAKEWWSYLSNSTDEASIPNVRGVYCESDSGLEDAERLRALLNVTHQDDPSVLPARRDKYQMNERVKEHGLACAQQRLCQSAAEACEFAKGLLEATPTSGTLLRPRPRVIVKPVRGVASESVQLCQSLDQVQDAWDSITDTTVFGALSGSKHNSVLVQEYLQGDEYALDIVTREGEHKVAAVWKYDKRPVNEAPFVYFQTRLVDASMEPDRIPRIQAYVREVLDTLGIRQGLTHNEVIWTADRGPVLVEVNHRQHNMDFTPLVMSCIGYNCLDMTLEALAGDGDLWELFPSEPQLRAHGCMVHLVNFCPNKGVLNQVEHLDEMSQLPSFFQGQVYDQFQTMGATVEPTIDIRSDAGWIQLIHENRDELERDYKQIVAWMPSMFHIDDET